MKRENKYKERKDKKVQEEVTRIFKEAWKTKYQSRGEEGEIIKSKKKKKGEG